MTGTEKELEDDFRHLVSCVDFNGYDPFSRDFMRACLVGQMLMTMKMLGNDVEEELEGAEKYLDMYKKTSNVMFRDMASDELRHAGNLIKFHMSKTSDANEKKRLEDYEKKRADMERTVSMATVQMKP